MTLCNSLGYMSAIFKGFCGRVTEQCDVLCPYADFSFTLPSVRVHYSRT
jgi:hypothetical protein